MLVDAFCVFNELDILEIRLRELAPYVDRFVIVEATRTHKGDPKPLHFAEHAARYAEWLPQIRHVVVDDMPPGDGLPAIRRRELFQRNAILRGIADCADDDVVLISDADEIPDPRLLPRDLPDGTVVVYHQVLMYYNVNTRSARPWPGTRACRVADARALSPHVIRCGLGQPDAHYPRMALAAPGGWHLSYFGDTAHIQTKMTQFLHQELVTVENTDPASIAARVAAGEDVWGRTEGGEAFTIGPASDLPGAVISDPMRYVHLFHPDWKPVFHEDWYHPEQARYVAGLARMAPAEGAIVEIGCWEGRSTVVLAQSVAPRVLHVVDTWRGNEDEDPDHESVVIARERDVLAQFVVNMERLTSDNWQHYPMDWRAWARGWDAPIAFLHLDAAHDEASVRDCLRAVAPFLIPGAIVCGDDAYADPVLAGARAALGERVQVIGGRLWLWQKEDD